MRKTISLKVAGFCLFTSLFFVIPAWAGMWSQPMKINPDSLPTFHYLQPEVYNWKPDVHIVSSSNRLMGTWCWSKKSSLHNDSVYVFYGVYDMGKWIVKSLLYKASTFDFQDYSAIQDNNDKAWLVWNIGAIPLKSKYDPWGFYYKTCQDTIWTPSTFAFQTGNAVDMDLTCDRQNRIHLVWLYEGNMGQYIYYCRYDNGWTMSQTVAAGSSDCNIVACPSVATDGNDSCCISYQDCCWYNFIDTITYNNVTYPWGGLDHDSSYISTSNLQGAKLASDTTGQIWACWERRDTIWTNYLDAGGWHTKSSIDTGQVIKLKSDRLGNVWLLFSVNNGLYVRMHEGSGWSLPILVLDTDSIYNADISFDNFNNPWVCWSRGEGAYSSVWRADTTPPSVQLQAPNGGEMFNAGNTVVILWNADSSVKFVDLSYSIDSGVTWQDIASLLPNSGSYSWVAPSIISNACRVKITVADKYWNTGEDVSDTAFAIVNGVSGQPADYVRQLKFSLQSCRPNPFGKCMSIGYELPVPGRAVLRIYNCTGQLVRTLVDRHQPAGSHRAVWDGSTDYGSKASTGVYIYRLESGSCKTSRRAMLIK